LAAEPKTGPSAASARALAARLASNHAGVIAWLRTAIRNSETGSLLVEWVRTGTLPDEFEVSGVGRGEASDDCIMINDRKICGHRVAAISTGQREDTGQARAPWPDIFA
jgi:hypothetical protein